MQPRDSTLVASLQLTIGRLYRGFRLEGASDLTTAQLALLGAVRRIGPTKLGDLATEAGLQPSTLTRGVQWLVDHGLVSRSTSEVDRRTTVVAMTPAGTELLNAVFQSKARHMARRMQALPEEDLDALVQAIPALQALLIEDEPPPT
jgi:DNA-binding MarR family transcriptional regulator